MSITKEELLDLGNALKEDGYEKERAALLAAAERIRLLEISLDFAVSHQDTCPILSPILQRELVKRTWARCMKHYLGEHVFVLIPNEVIAELLDPPKEEPS